LNVRQRMATAISSADSAQASTSVLLLVVSMLPLVTVFNQDGEAPWHRWVPALAQHALMTRVLKGEALSWELMAVPAGVCVVLAGVGVLAVARSLRGASLR